VAVGAHQGEERFVEGRDVVDLYRAFVHEGVQVWVDGGWGIDALLERQTRPHKDFDAIAAFDDLPVVTALLADRGFALKVVWEENRWVAHTEPVQLIGREAPYRNVATAFVLSDPIGREIDIHAVRFDDAGRGIPAWNSDFIFPVEAFDGRGVIEGVAVRCLSAEMQMRTHTGYELQQNDLHDLRLLHERFGVDYPEEHAWLRMGPAV
jgi:lincosamide nucleotidyltransferase A/C/D/E